MNNNYSKALEILNSHLVANKLRMTYERNNILKFLYEDNSHMDIETIYNRLSQIEGSNVSKATIYNTLDLFVECGIARKHYFSSKNISIYEKTLGSMNHDHFICKNCNKVLEFCDPRISKIQKSVEEVLKVKVDSHEMQFYGTCNDPKCNK